MDHLALHMFCVPKGHEFPHTNRIHHLLVKLIVLPNLIFPVNHRHIVRNVQVFELEILLEHHSGAEVQGGLVSGSLLSYVLLLTNTITRVNARELFSSSAG